MTAVGFPLPSDFPSASHEAVFSRIAPLGQIHPNLWPEWLGAWNAIAYRFCACTEYDESFNNEVRQIQGRNPISLEQYRQERDLYGFFLNGWSVIESTCYGLSAIASMLNANRFPMATGGDRRKINPESTRNRFSAAFQTEGITTALDALINEQTYKDWKDVRNVLIHRLAPPRTFHITSSQPLPPSQWNLQGGISLDQNTTSSKRLWLAGILRNLLHEADTFTGKNFPI